jgi:ABC-type phosphate/phosphonate transport system substrate-binding protein
MNKAMRVLLKIQRAVFSIISIFCINSVNAEVIFTAPPRENQAQGIALYGTLVNRLTKLIGEHVVYQQPGSWLEYTKKMRDDKYDIVFDGPHFAAWRIKHLHHIPVASLPGTLDFLLVTRKNNKDINSLRDLVGKKICGFPSPHLATDMIYNLFTNPVIQPVIFEVKGGISKMYRAFRDGKCQATIFRDMVYKQLPIFEQGQLKTLAKTEPMPNQTITVSKRLKNKSKQISKFLISNEGAIVADKLLNRYSKNAKYFQRTNARIFKGAEHVLEGMVWGW